jgi:hypothetical protein
MASFKHNKKRNTGLVHEFLVRRVSQSMVDGDKGLYQKTMEILRKYYAEGTVLSEERELFDVIRNTRGVTESAARRILGEIQRAAKVQDARKIDIKKSNLLKEVNHAFGPAFFTTHRVPEYRLLASIQMVVDATRAETLITESVAKIQLEEGLIQYMTTKGDYAVKAAPTAKSEVDALVMRMVAKRFEEKYAKALTAPQKVLLEKYIRYQVTGDEQPLRKLVDDESKRVVAVLEKASCMKEVIEDERMTAKLNEARAKFGKDRDLDAAVENLMLYQKLVEEIESDE